MFTSLEMMNESAPNEISRFDCIGVSLDNVGMDSYWFLKTPAEKKFPALAGNLEVDVTIIGGGITGLTTAYFLLKNGFRVALLEQEYIAGGDSGYSTSFISHYADNTADTTNAWIAFERAFEIINEIVKGRKIDCDFRILNALVFTKRDADSLELLYKQYLQVDSSIRLLAADEASKFCGFDAKSALLIKHEAVFDPRKYLLGMAMLLQSEGAHIFEMSKAIQVTDDGHAILTVNGTVKTGAIIIATGCPFAIFPDIARLISKSATYVVGLRFVENIVLGDYLFWDDEAPYHYFRKVNSTDVMLGGEDRAFLFKDISNINVTQAPFINLKKYIQELVGQKCEILQKWQGGIYDTSDHLPLIGHHSLYGDNIYFACGFGGNGITYGTLAGEIISDILTGKKNKFIKQYSFDRLK